MKKALITGISGQVGSYLAEYLLSQGYDVWGTTRWEDSQNLTEATKKRVRLLFADMRDFTSLELAIRKSWPDEIYNLAAQSFVPPSWTRPEVTFDVDAGGLARILELVSRIHPKARVYQASTSEMFGGNSGLCNEDTVMIPTSPYGVAKYAAHKLCHVYRTQGIFVVSGVCFNHESPRRGPEMVTRKITMHVAQWAVGVHENPIRLGNLQSVKDWGFAGDYVKAMHRMLQQDEARDYVIGTGKPHTVEQLLIAAIDAAGLNREECLSRVVIAPEFVRVVDTLPVYADYSRAKEILGWEPETSFQELVSMMVRSDIRRLQEARQVSNEEHEVGA